MPQHDPNDPSATGRPPFGGDAESIDDEDFWERARRTKKEDKKASKRWRRDRDGDGERSGRRASSARKRKTPPRSGEQVSFGLPPTGGAKGGTDYPVSPRVARARRQLQGLPADLEPELPGRGGFRDRPAGRQEPPGPPPIPDPPRQPIPMPSAPPGSRRMPPPTAPTNPVRPPGRATPPSPSSPPLPPSRPAPGPPTAPTPQVPPTGPGTPPLMSPLLANSRLAGRRAQRSGLTGQTPAVPDTPGPSTPGGPLGPSTPGGPLSTPGAPTPPGPERTLRRPPRLSGRTGRATGETPSLPPPSSTRGRSRLTGPGSVAGAAGAADRQMSGDTGSGGLRDSGRPPSLPQRPPPRRSVGAPPAARSSDPDVLASPPLGTPATGPLPSSRRRTSAAPPMSPPAGTPAWDPASTTESPGLGRPGRTGRTRGRTGPGAGAGAEGLAGTAGAGAGAASRRPGAIDPGATGKMPRTPYPATGRTPTGPGATGAAGAGRRGTTGSNGPMLNATQPTPATGARRRGPTTGSTPLMGPNSGGNVGPISAELPVVEPGPVAGVEPSPWEAPPLPGAGTTRPVEPRVGPLSGEVPALDERFDALPGRGRPPRGPQPATTQVDLDTGLDRGFNGGFDGPPVSPAPDRGPRPQIGAVGAGPGTMTRRPSYGDGGFDDHDDVYDDDADDRDDDFDGSERQGCGRFAVPLVVAAVVLCIVLVATAIWARRQINPGGSPGDAVTVEIESGQSTSDIGKALEDANVITSASVWTWYVRFRGGGDVQAGSYELHENMSMGDVLDALTTGPQPAEARPVTVAEGLSIQQLVSKLTSGNGAVEGFTAEGMQAALDDPAMRSEILPADSPSIEGTLFPETYNITEDATEAELVQKMVDQFTAVTTELNLAGGAEGLGYSPYEVLIVASLVEEEAKFPEERAQVARVIYNRLGRDQPLQVDATSCYDQPEGQCRVGADPSSPYDTRDRKGLPLTPISSPGRASIEAALHPAAGDALYYVRKDAEGHHLFTASYDEFLTAKQTCIDEGWGCG